MKRAIEPIILRIREIVKVGEGKAADILWHDKPRITYGLYSGGTSLEPKHKAIKF